MKKVEFTTKELNIIATALRKANASRSFSNTYGFETVNDLEKKVWLAKN